jgi:hypothetical protein
VTDERYSKIDTTFPHSARIWNYWSGGKDNFAIDREVGDKVLAVMPTMRDVATQSNLARARMITYLASEVSIRQFLDIGTGLPTNNNTHQVAQRVAPESRIVYVDNDPLVLAHARALLTSSPQGTTDYIDADMHEPELILLGARSALDFDQPIAVMFFGILGHVEDDAEVIRIVTPFVEAIPSGSYLAINDGTDEFETEQRRAATEIINMEGPPYYPRTTKQLLRFFDGFEMVPPGIVSTSLWRPEPGTEPNPVAALCGLGRKP